MYSLSRKTQTSHVTDPKTLLFILDLHWNSSYLSEHVETVMEKTENVFWLKLIRKGPKLPQKEIDSTRGGKEMSIGN